MGRGGVLVRLLGSRRAHDLNLWRKGGSLRLKRRCGDDGRGQGGRRDYFTFAMSFRLDGEGVGLRRYSSGRCRRGQIVMRMAIGVKSVGHRRVTSGPVSATTGLAAIGSSPAQQIEHNE